MRRMWRRARGGDRRGGGVGADGCGGDMTGLGFQGLAHLKRRIVATGMMTSSMYVATYELSLPVATVVVPVTPDY
jgi:hypothetical protein